MPWKGHYSEALSFLMALHGKEFRINAKSKKACALHETLQPRTALHRRFLDQDLDIPQVNCTDEANAEYIDTGRH
ncbi:hypothetical protein HGM15179_014823 [Zosterops borbonicus]|uniref:Uncharacterized protein n=1 Tax=Zosterops borbonicus TaxID=364589 RepID=A0A8K1LFZ4_9PASS|nr:hypothetical protein HGM15179_014823 [Zosterops borbonicus]